MKKIILFIISLMLLTPASAKPTSFQVRADGKKVQVYEMKVSPSDSLLRMRGMDDKEESANIYEMAAFCSFDIDRPVSVKVKSNRDVTSTKVLPSSRGIVPSVDGREITFEAIPGDKLTLEINGDEIHTLHIFANPEETEEINPDDPDVIYFGPGVHHVSRVVVRSNQTLYIAPGAVLYGEMFEHIPGEYSPVISLLGDNIKVRGRGIVDGSLCPTLSTNLLYVKGSNISIEGIILRDASVWTVPVMNSENVVIDGIKILGYRANSDGIDICNSRNVVVKNCFIRTLDDLIVIKTVKNGDVCENVHAYKNILWNEVAHAVSVGAEILKDIRNVVFEDCDIVHDKGREWSMRVYHCDQAKVSDIVFRNLRIEESKNFISLWINKAVWTRSQDRGHIDGVVFEDIKADGVVNPKVEFLGYDDDHLVENVSIRNVVVNGRPLTANDVKKNDFVRNITIK